MLQNHPLASEIAAGQRALRRAAWLDAKAAFEQALSAADHPEAHDGLGLALWWLNDIAAAHQHRALAYNGFKEAGMLGRASLIACWLAREQLFFNSHPPAMQGWFARAEHLVSQNVSESDRAWYAILRASVLATANEMLTISSDTISAARRVSNSDLEAFALAFCGQALVQLGQVGTGMTRLDEAMTMATSGEVTDFTVISEVFCVMLSACEAAGDLARSDLWCRRAAEFAEQYRCPFLSAYCRTVYGGLMTALGRWQDAEAALVEAIGAFERGHKGLRIHAVIKLADLKMSQGRIEEAALLLEGLDDQGAAVVPLARLWLQKGETALAKAVIEQMLPPDSAYTLSHLPAVLLLVEVLLLLDQTADIQRIITYLTDMATRANSSLFSAQIEFTKGRVRLHQREYDAAKACFNSALMHLRSYEHSLLGGQIRLHMAQTLQATDPPGAIAWARGALATFERIGAEHDAAEAAGLLRVLGASRGAAPRLNKALTQREIEIVSLLALGLTNRDIATRLVISGKTVEHHVSSILSKLGLRTRAEVAVLVASGKLGSLITDDDR